MARPKKVVEPKVVEPVADEPVVVDAPVEPVADAPVEVVEPKVVEPVAVVDEAKFAEWWKDRGEMHLTDGHGARSLIQLALAASGNGVDWLTFARAQEDLGTMLKSGNVYDACKVAFLTK